MDYLGLAEDLKNAMATYTESRGRGQVCVDQEEALCVLEREIEVCRDILYGCEAITLRAASPKAHLASLPFVIEPLTRKMAETGGSRPWTKSPGLSR